MLSQPDLVLALAMLLIAGFLATRKDLYVLWLQARIYLLRKF